FAPGGVCRAVAVAGNAVRSYRTVSPLPRQTRTRRGGLFSVALSLGSLPPDVIRHRVSMEPGLSSPATFRSLPERPSSRLTPTGMGSAASPVKPCGAGTLLLKAAHRTDQMNTVNNGQNLAASGAMSPRRKEQGAGDGERVRGSLLEGPHPEGR